MLLHRRRQKREIIFDKTVILTITIVAHGVLAKVDIKKDYPQGIIDEVKIYVKVLSEDLLDKKGTILI